MLPCLAFISALRVGGFHNLNMILLTRNENKYSFHFNKLSKSWKQGQKNHLVEFLNYPDDKILCVVAGLCEY